MDLLDQLIDGSCGEPSPVMRFVHELNSMDAPAVLKMKSDFDMTHQSSFLDEKDTKKVANTNPLFSSVEFHSSIEQFFLTDPTQLESESIFPEFLSSNLQYEFLSTFHQFQSDTDDSKSIEDMGSEHHGHADDCTPSSGPHYLIEVQNPTWETTLYSNFNLTMEKLRQLPFDVDNTLNDYKSRFMQSVAEIKSEYPFMESVATRDVISFDQSVKLAKEAKFVEAINPLETSLKETPENAEGWALLAFANYMCQNDSRCISACKRYFRHKSENPASQNLVLLLLATCLLNESDFPAAQAVLFHWMMSYLDVVQDLQSNFRESDNNITVILKTCEIKLKENPNDGPLHWAMAILNFGLGNYAAAGRHFEFVLKQNPRSPCVFNQIGACLQNLGRYDDAIVLQNQALELCPGFYRALYNKALTQCSMGNAEIALQTIITAVNNLTRDVSGYSDPFWYIAARIAPRLAHKNPSDHANRLKIMSAILRRNLEDFKKFVEARL